MATTKPTITNFQTVAPLIIQKYERYLPSAFDDSLSMLEKMNKIIEYLNQIGELSNSVVEQWNEVMEWVLNDGLESAVDEQLNEWEQDGTLDTIINQDVLGSRAEIIVSDTQPINPDEQTFWYQLI